MAPHSTTVDGYALEPLEGMGFPVPFPPHINIPPARQQWIEDETPTTVHGSLPTPDLRIPPRVNLSHQISQDPRPRAWFDTTSFEVCAGTSTPQWVQTTDPPRDPVPNAPLLKDLDSFTDGTGAGSFDFSLHSGSAFDEPPHQNTSVEPPTVLSPETVTVTLPSENLQQPPSRTIETWRDDVIMSISSEEYAHEEKERIAVDEPRGLKRNLSWTSFEDLCENSGPDRRGRWGTSMETLTDDGNDSNDQWQPMVGVISDPAIATVEKQDDVEPLLCSSMVLGAGHSFDILPMPTRPASAPPSSSHLDWK